MTWRNRWPLKTVRGIALVAMLVLLATADIGLVNLDNAHQFPKFFVRQSGTEPVAHVPSRAIGAEAEGSVNLKGADAFLAGQHHVQDTEPLAQRLIGVLENRSGDVREPIAAVRRAAVALPLIGHRCHGVGNGHSATRAFHNAARPTVFDQIIGAGILGREGHFPFADGHLMDALAGRQWPNPSISGIT